MYRHGRYRPYFRNADQIREKLERAESDIYDDRWCNAHYWTSPRGGFLMCALCGLGFHIYGGNEYHLLDVIDMTVAERSDPLSGVFTWRF